MKIYKQNSSTVATSSIVGEILRVEITAKDSVQLSFQLETDLSYRFETMKHLKETHGPNHKKMLGQWSKWQRSGIYKGKKPSTAFSEFGSNFEPDMPPYLLS